VRVWQPEEVSTASFVKENEDDRRQCVGHVLAKEESREEERGIDKN